MSLPARLQDQALIRRSRRAVTTVVAACMAVGAAWWAVSLHAQPAATGLRTTAAPATLVVDWPSRRTVTETGASTLDAEMLPGAVAQVFALAAAAEAGLVSASSTHMCRRVVTADGRRFACAHPDLHRALTPAEALAYACSDFFADLATRLPRASLNDVRRRAGLMAIGDDVPWTSAVLGLAGPTTSPRTLMSAVARVAGVGPDAPVTLTPGARALVRAGLRGAADYGPATALRARGTAALVKGGASPQSDGRALGLVIAFAPPDVPTKAVLVAAPSGAGFDAAAIAASLVRPDVPATAAAAAAPVPAAAPLGAPAAGSSATDAALWAASGSTTVRIGVALPDGKVRIETLPLEEYVSRVISGEGQPRAGAAAHEALAIVIRTFALANRHRHRAEGYDLCDSTHCQVMRPSLKVAREAALATAGRVLLDKGQPAFVYYSAHCGGIPALASEVWPGAVDYRPGEPHDDACADEPGWSSDLTSAQVERALRAAGLTGRRVTNLAVTTRTTSDRAGRLAVAGWSPATVSAYEFRMAVGRTLGWQLVRSTAFEVSRTGDGYHFAGVGYGHGVGLCVVGAGKRAARGESAAQILRAYFGDLAQSTVPAETTMANAGRPPTAPQIGAMPAPQIGAAPVPQLASPSKPQLGAPASRGAAVGSAAALPPAAPQAPGVRDIALVLPPGDERERASVLELVRRTRDEVAARAGVPVPASMAITVHVSMETFGHVTGQPWWVAASTVDGAIDLVPLAELRRRGTLESTLRQEVAHVILDAHLRTRPAWVREGASIVFSSPPVPLPPPGARVQCPSDAELLRPLSGGTEREAAARAERCVRRQLAQGRAWRDVR